MNLIRYPRAACLCLAAFLTPASFAYIVEYATDTFGTFQPRITGSASITTVSSPVRAGSVAFRHTGSGDPRRAELDIATFTMKRGAHWYGFSYYIPDDETWADTITQFVAQWRFSNQKAPGYSAPNVAMGNAAESYLHGGSGHHLLVKNGRWVFELVHQDRGAMPSAGIKGASFDLGPVTKNVWTDWVVEGKWTHVAEQGSVKIWRRVNGGAFVRVLDYFGPTWVPAFAAGSQMEGEVVPSPNFTVGLYASDAASASQTRNLFSDELRVSNTQGPEGFHEVAPGGSPGTFDYGPANTVNGAIRHLEIDGVYVKRFTSGPSIELVSEAGASGGAFAQLNTTSASGTLRVDFAALHGTYNLKFRYRTGPDRGRFQPSLNNVALGGVIDAYSAAPGYAEVNFGTVNLSTAHNHALRFAVNGKNTSSNGFLLGADRITLTDLNFTPTGLVDPINGIQYEIEDSYQSRFTSGPTISIVNDPAASFGQHVVLQATGAGPVLRVDLPWVPAGEHRVIVRHLTGPDRGRVQLQIDNVNFGPVFDQYSASPGTATLDLGTINFAAGAPRQIKYTVQSKNVASSGHTVSADYIDFQPVVPSISIEAEASNVQRFSSGPTILITNDGSASGGQHVTLAAANPPVLRLAVPSLPAGSHVYTIRYRTGPDQGRFQPMINEVPVGPVIDQYAASVGWTQTTLGTSLLPFAGTQQFKFVGAGKNASASAGNLSVDLLLLDQTGPAPTFVFEAEASNVQRFSSGPPIVIANENNASGGQHVTLDHPSQGPVLRLDVPNVAVGSYGLWVRFRAGPDRGIFQPSINQINVGSPIDQYAASTGYRQVYAGQFTVTTAGTQQFRLVGAGKNASSSAFNLSCDLIAFD